MADVYGHTVSSVEVSCVTCVLHNRHILHLICQVFCLLLNLCAHKIAYIHST